MSQVFRIGCSGSKPLFSGRSDNNSRLLVSGGAPYFCVSYQVRKMWRRSG